jgi:hypothetical protein
VIHELDDKGQLAVRPPKNKRRAIPYTDPDASPRYLAPYLAAPRPLAGALPAPLLPQAAVLTAIPSTVGSSGPYAEHRQAKLFPVSSDLVIDEEIPSEEDESW